MGKKKSSLKLKKLIQERLSQARGESFQEKITLKPSKTGSQKPSESQEIIKNKNFSQFNPDFKKIGLNLLILATILIIFFLISSKTSFFNILSNKLFVLFQKS